jgi:hypothetical protein
VLEFLAEQLSPWRERLLKTNPQISPTPARIEEVDVQRLTKELCDLVKRHKFLSVSETVNLLDNQFTEPVIQEYCGKLKEIEKIVHPNGTLLVWHG